MIPLVTINLALEFGIALLKFFATDEGQKLLVEARQNREQIASWWQANAGNVGEKIQGALSAQNPTLKAIGDFFGGKRG